MRAIARIAASGNTGRSLAIRLDSGGSSDPDPPAMKLGLIGLKGHQSVVLTGMKQLGGWEVVGIAETDAKEVEKLKKRDPQAKNAVHFEDWRRLLDHTQMDACLV